MASQQPKQKTVFVTGASGFIGSAICRAFVRAGYRTLGLVRRKEATADLVLIEATPVLGTFTDLGFLDALYKTDNTFDVIVSCTEAYPGYKKHFDEVLHLVKALAETSNKNGVRPLVLWSSGCKDYGTTPQHGDPALAPHTEESPCNPPEILVERMQNCPRVFGETALFDACVIRPTNVYGYTSSYLGGLFEFAAAEQKLVKSGTKDPVLVVPGLPNDVNHNTHIDDCAEAYLALAEHPDRKAVGGQAFNISSRRYETTAELLGALAAEYGFTGGVKFVPTTELPATFPAGLSFSISFSQWVGSDKIRKLTGWHDKRRLFSEDIHTYRASYEATRDRGNYSIELIKARQNNSLKEGWEEEHAAK